MIKPPKSVLRQTRIFNLNLYPVLYVLSAIRNGKLIVLFSRLKYLQKVFGVFTERDRERQRETDRQTETQRYTDTERETEAERQRRDKKTFKFLGKWSHVQSKMPLKYVT